MIDLDRLEFDMECPRCRFYVSFSFRDARLRDALICRGCKATIQLDDRANECRRARERVNAAMRRLQATLGSFNTTLNIRI